MALTSGNRFGAYEIGPGLGAGGMGEVYSATDTKLKRRVAIKVLPSSLSGDPDRLARFQREAEVLAALNHPHIAAIYGVEESDGVKGLVMELVDGPTLADLIATSPIPIADALPIAKQIASALEAAHEQGIVHRDLKPANIKVKPDGTVKVLDFGLAKNVDARPAGSPDHSPTITTPAMTLMGVVLGTAAYMSPEQARGRTVDKRTDIWAFGVVLYEMLTRKRAFEGEDVSLTLASVMKSDPDLKALPPDVPSIVRLCLERCLQKDPRQRLRDIGDVRLLLDGAFDQAGTASSAPRVAPKSLVRRLLPIAAAITIGALIGLAGWNIRTIERQKLIRFEHTVADGLAIQGGNRPLIAVSPDGGSIVFTASDGLHLHSLSERGDRRILTSQVVSSPIFSPDGRSIAYAEGAQLKRMDIGGGAPVVIAPVAIPYGMTWTADDMIVFATTLGISRVSANGGQPEVVVRANPDEQLVSPVPLPGGDAILFTAYKAGEFSAGGGILANSSVVAHSLRNGERRTIVSGGANPKHDANGHLLYTSNDGLFAIDFDARTLQTRGAPQPLAEDVRLGIGSNGIGMAHYDISRTGTLAYLEASDNGIPEPLVWVSRDGTATPVSTIQGGAGIFNSPRLSSDDQRVLLVAQGDARVYDLATGRETRVTSDRSVAAYATWIAGDRAVAYASTRKGLGGVMNVWRHPLDGTGPPEQITKFEGRGHLDGWAPDGTMFSTHHHPSSDTGKFHIFLVPVRGGAAAEPRQFSDGAANEEGGSFSPDGRYLAYATNISSQTEIVIRSVAGPAVVTPVSVGGGREPMWGQNGELFYRRSADDTMMAVPVTTAPTLKVGIPVALFSGPGTPGGSSRANYAVTSDGQRFIMSNTRARLQGYGANRPSISVVLNWIDGLRP